MQDPQTALRDIHVVDVFGGPEGSEGSWFPGLIIIPCLCMVPFLFSFRMMYCIRHCSCSEILDFTNVSKGFRVPSLPRRTGKSGCRQKTKLYNRNSWSPLTFIFTRIEPAGAGGATGASHQLRRHQLGRGGRWRRSRHLRRVQRPRQAGCGTKMGEFGVATVARTPFLSALFMKLQLNSCSNWSKKRPAKS